ncbi:MAG: hypothetical protein K8R69_04525 [Deltaproteobacteria bacterium]|nr:hypothetical protein [Deltaproteobacteria bacterium]
MDNSGLNRYDNLIVSRRPYSILLRLAACVLLWACSAANSPGGAAGPGGGPVGGIAGGPVDGGVSAAQPMDTGAAGAKKDIDAYNYILRDAAATVLCQEGQGQVRVRFQGFLLSEKPTTGETFGSLGLLRVSDLGAGRYQVTQTSDDQAQMGFFKTTLKVQSPLNVAFFHVQSYDGPLETLLTVHPGDISFAIQAETKPDLKVEQSPLAGNPCLEKAKDHEVSEDLVEVKPIFPHE